MVTAWPIAGTRESELVRGRWWDGRARVAKGVDGRRATGKCEVFGWWSGLMHLRGKRGGSIRCLTTKLRYVCGLHICTNTRTSIDKEDGEMEVSAFDDFGCLICLGVGRL